jgi:hypothetical protein
MIEKKRVYSFQIYPKEKGYMLEVKFYGGFEETFAFTTFPEVIKKLKELV